MSRTIARTGLIVVTLFCLSVGRGAVAGMSVANFEGGFGTSDDLKNPSTKNFKLKGGGQIDTATFSLEFSGKSSPLGKYNATGQVDPSTFQIQGIFTTGKDNCSELGLKQQDTVTWAASFQQGPLGDIQALFTFTGGTGKFAGATGTASGPVILDPDFMFTINLEGKISY
jgi:hypothetical protein